MWSQVVLRKHYYELVEVIESSWAIPNSKKWCYESSVLNMPASLEDSAVATGLEKISFHSNPKERQWQRMFKLQHNHTFESPSDSKEIKPASAKGNQPWLFTGRTDAEAEAPILWPLDAKSWLIGKDPTSAEILTGNSNWPHHSLIWTKHIFI